MKNLIILASLLVSTNLMALNYQTLANSNNAFIQICTKSESDGSGLKSESDGSGLKSESDGSGLKSESDGSGINSESDGSGINSESDGSGINSESDGSGIISNRYCFLISKDNNFIR